MECTHTGIVPCPICMWDTTNPVPQEMGFYLLRIHFHEEHNYPNPAVPLTKTKITTENLDFTGGFQGTVGTSSGTPQMGPWQAWGKKVDDAFGWTPNPVPATEETKQVIEDADTENDQGGA